VAVAGSIADSIKLWDVRDNTLKRHLPWNTWAGDDVCCVSFSPDGNILAAGGLQSRFPFSLGQTGGVTFWDTRTGKQLATRYGHFDGATSLAFSPDSKTLATGDCAGVIRFWDVP
jgi:WD40 repeat protein